MWMKIMKTIQMTIDEPLLERVDKATDSLGMARSAFIRRALESALQDLAISELERKHIDGYQRQPVKAGEFDMWETEQAWGES
jgi:metal-responsive CopG/Arc/MetJ family transcriptional regulator